MYREELIWNPDLEQRRIDGIGYDKSAFESQTTQNEMRFASFEDTATIANVDVNN